MVCRACAASKGTAERHEGVLRLITTPHYSWFTSRLSYQLQAILSNSHASNCWILEEFHFINFPIFKEEHFQWVWLKWQCLYWHKFSQEKKKASFQVIASLFITPNLPSMAVQNLSVFKCYLLHIQSFFKEYFLELHHMQPPTPPHALPTHPNNSGSRVTEQR